MSQKGSTVGDHLTGGPHTCVMCDGTGKTASEGPGSALCPSLCSKSWHLLVMHELQAPR